jgi:hypothetical protein
MALKVRSSWPTEIDGTAELELVLVLELLPEDELEELQAAAARHKASAAESTSPFLAT